MASLVENINQARSDFRAIRQSLIGKMLAVPNGTPTSQYAALIDSLDTRNIQDFQEWMIYGGLEEDIFDYETIDELLAANNGSIYDTLLANEASAAYAAYLKESIANKIKNNSTYLRKALLSQHNEMFFNSRFNFDENIANMVEQNPTVTADTYQGIVEFSADRCTNPIPGVIEDNGYYGYNAFSGTYDTADLTKIYGQRGIWSAFGTNQWVQYKYNEQKYLCYVRIYSLRDNAPIGVKIEGSNDGENFTLIKEQTLDGIIGVNHYNDVICHCTVPYQYYRFTITDSYYSGTCNVGEIEIYTYK